MEAIKHVALHQVAGAPLWAWLFIAVLPVLNEAIMRSKNVRALSAWQFLGDVIKRTPLSKVPLLSSVIDKWGSPSSALPLPTMSGTIVNKP